MITVHAVIIIVNVMWNIYFHKLNKFNIFSTDIKLNMVIDKLPVMDRAKWKLGKRESECERGRGRKEGETGKVMQ